MGFGDRPHRYHFVVHALDLEVPRVRPASTPGFVAYALAFHTVARAAITATFRRPDPT